MESLRENFDEQLQQPKKIKRWEIHFLYHHEDRMLEHQGHKPADCESPSLKASSNGKLKGKLDKQQATTTKKEQKMENSFLYRYEDRMLELRDMNLLLKQNAFDTS